MVERLYQFHFDEDGETTTPQNVTPKEFAGLEFPCRNRPDRLLRLNETGRFVREASDQVQVTSPDFAGNYLLNHVFVPFEQFDQEETWVLLLNNKHWITHDVMIYRGTVNQGLIRPVEIFKAAVWTNAPVIIMAHNHPSGDPNPSPEDVQVTLMLEQAGKQLEIELLDHFVIGKGCWVSLREKGLGLASERGEWRAQRYATINLR